MKIRPKGTFSTDSLGLYEYRMKNYRNGKWEGFRVEVIELDGGRCVDCEKSESDGIILQVHHKSYIPGRKPWEYSYKDCETICKGCHAIRHGIIPPRSGWQYCGEEDLGDLDGECDYCGSQLRYLFFVFHPQWGSMGVGTVCCDTLTESDSASAYARNQRRRENRIRCFIDSPRWRTANGIHKIVQKGFEVEIFPSDKGYKIRMNEEEGAKSFSDMIEAKTKVYDVIASGEAENYFNKKMPQPRLSGDRGKERRSP